jgi:hypothetical protein
LDAVFLVSLVMGILSVPVALGVEWKSIKAQKVENEEGAQD